MTELEQNLRNILTEKQNKILPENIKEGVQIYDVIGTLHEGVDTSDADAVANDIRYGKTAYVNGNKLTGAIDFLDMGKVPVWYYNFNCAITCTFEQLINRNPKHTMSAIGVTSQISKLVRIDNFTDILRTTPQVGDILINIDTRCYYNGGQNEPYITVGQIVEFEISGGLFTCDFKVYGGVRRAEFTNAIGLTPEKLVSGNNILGVVGTASGGIDTSDATINADDMPMDKTAYARGQKLTGTVSYAGLGGGMFYGPNDLTITETPDYLEVHRNQIPVTIMLYAGANTGVTAEKSEVASAIGLTADKILEGNTILGITGTGGAAQEQQILTMLEEINGAHI